MRGGLHLDYEYYIWDPNFSLIAELSGGKGGMVSPGWDLNPRPAAYKAAALTN